MTREVTITIRCDVCKAQFNETSEGSNAVTFTVGKQQWEMDVCYGCLGGGFFENAREITEKKQPKPKPFTCNACDKSYATERGLSRHLSFSGH